ncbi:MAG: hypothetical protein AB7G12_05350 [Thermoanaerobaculia bacterium]
MRTRITAAIAAIAASAAVVVPAGAADFPNYLGTQARGEIVSGIPTLSDPSQTYDLYLPTASAPGRKLPVLFLFDPRSRGRLAAELFRPAAEELGWILVSSNNTMSDGSGEPNARAINATIPDAVKRLPVDEKRMYATGFSGGAVLAWTVGLKGKFLAGVISVGGRPAPEHAALKPAFPLFSTSGLRDFNYQPTRELDGIAAAAGVPHRLQFFPGPHAWCPPETARQAMVWLETLAMRDGLAPRDEARIAAFLGEEMAAAAELEKGGDVLGAARRYGEIAEAFRGLGDAAQVKSAEASSTSLAASAAARSAVKEEKAAEKYESQGFRRIGEAMALARGEIVPPAAKLRQIVGLDEARKRSTEDGEAGRAAARHLEAIATHLGFYLTQEMFAQGDYIKARPGLTVAAEARPGDPFLLYNLACAEARSGEPKAAIENLSKALDAGLPASVDISQDADLASLRGLPGFKALLERTAKPN